MRASWTRTAVLGLLLTGGLAHRAAGGSLSGTVRDATTGLPVYDVLVEAFNSNGVDVCSEWTDHAGVYSCGELAAGAYYVRTEDASWRGYLDELYDGIACPLESCRVTSGTPVHVTADATTTGIDFSLSPGGRIRGRLTDAATGVPLASVYLEVDDSGGSYVTYAYTDSSGLYTTGSMLPTGSYFVRTLNSQGYFDEVYSDVSWPCAVTSGTPVGVTAGATTTGIDFALSPGGRIRGTVTDGLTGQPLSDVYVLVYDWKGSQATTGRTDASGTFTTEKGLRSGTYYARTSNSRGYVDELYDDVPCTAGSCTVTRGVPIHVTAGATTTGISFALQPGGRISGQVRLGEPIPPDWDLPIVFVRVYDATGRQVASTMLEGPGGYSYTTDGGLASGTYYARASAWGYLGELYDHVPCPGDECAVTGGTPIAVTTGTTTSGIDFDLTPGGPISGTVTDAGTGAPLADVQVEVYEATGEYITSAYTGVSGHYATYSSLAPGTYYAKAVASRDHLAELYDDIPCPGGWCEATNGKPITVSAATPTTGIDFALTRGGAISGTVTDAATGLPLAGVWVGLWDSPESPLLTSVETDSSGAYTSEMPLSSGTYYAGAFSANHVSELYDHVPCPGGACTVASGTPISVTAGTTRTGIDFALAGGEAVGGTVRDAATGLPLARVWVYLYNSAGRSVTSAQTDLSGVYTTEHRLPSGTYFARTGNYLGYIDELYDDVPCPSYTCPVTSGTPISVTAGATTSGIDFGLMPMGRITGTVRDAATSLPLSGALVIIYRSDGSSLSSAAYVYTASTGAWATDVSLLPGTYYARTSGTAGHLDELYDDIPCPYYTCPVTTGRSITVTAGATTTGVDFALAHGGAIEGTVTDRATRLPLAYVSVRVYDASGSLVSTALTNALGVYTTSGGPGLVSGTYYVRTSNSLGYVDELYYGVRCPGESCPVTVGSPIAVTAGSTTGGINFALARGGRIGSTVTDAATGQPLEGVEVSIHDASGRRVTGGATDGSGAFASVDALLPGTYYARTSNTLGYGDELYDDIPCPGGACSVTTGTPIVVTAGAAASIAFALEAGGRIGGAVTDSGTGLPVAGARVRVYDSAGAAVASASTDSSGAWETSTGLPTGTYFARTESSPGHVDELYDDIPCPLGVCAVTSGTAIEVTAGARTSGIDFALDPSPPSSFYTVAPCRVLDTRNPDGPLGGPALVAGAERTFTVAGACGIPVTAKAVSVNVTVTQPSNAGYVRLYPAGAPSPRTATVNFAAGQTRAGNAIVPLGASGQVTALAMPSGTVHLVLDVSGYYEQ
jgi:hypothetical protein